MPNNIPVSLRRGPRTVLLLPLICILCTAPVSFAQDVGLKQDVACSLDRDIAGSLTYGLDDEVEASLSTQASIVAIDEDASIDVVGAGAKVAVLADLRREVDLLSSAAAGAALCSSLNRAENAIAAIESAGESETIETLSDSLQGVEDALDDGFLDLIVADPSIPGNTKGSLLALGKPLEQRYDYLKYIASKVRLYAIGECRDQLAASLQRTVCDSAAGKTFAYLCDLKKIIADTETWRGTQIKEEEADRIRGKADSLLRKIGEQGTTRSCDVGLSTTIAGIDVDCGLTWQSADFRAPTRDFKNGTFEFSAEKSGKSFDAEVSYKADHRDYCDPLKDDDDKFSRNMDIVFSWDHAPEDCRTSDDDSLAGRLWECESFTANASLRISDDRYPNKIDSEIALENLSSVCSGIEDLVGRVKGLGLDETLETRLLNDLTDAQNALGAGDRGGGVDSLEDFIDDVADAKWDGSIASPEAECLLAAASCLLPRKIVRRIDLPLSLEFPFRGGDVVLQSDWDRYSYPSNSALSHTATTGEATYTKETDAYSFTTNGTHEALVYPNAGNKNRLRDKWQGKLKYASESFESGITMSDQSTTYPNARDKDECVYTIDWDLSFALPGGKLTLGYTDKKTKHLRNTPNPVEHVKTFDLDLAWDIQDGVICAELIHTQLATQLSPASEVVSKQTNNVGLSLKKDITSNLKADFSCKWNGVADYEDASKDSHDFNIELELNVAL